MSFGAARRSRSGVALGCGCLLRLRGCRFLLPRMLRGRGRAGAIGRTSAGMRRRLRLHGSGLFGAAEFGLQLALGREPPAVLDLEALGTLVLGWHLSRPPLCSPYARGAGCALRAADGLKRACSSDLARSTD